MKLDLSGKVAVVTGGGSGIGFAIAEQLIAHGAKVLLNDINEGLAESAALQLGESQCLGLTGDASDPVFIEEMIQRTASYFGRVDICVANAGITSHGAFLDTTPTQFEKLTDLNLKGTFFLAQAGARQMISEGHGGRILLISSVTGVLAHNDLVAYGMTKAGISMLAKALVVELAHHGITTNVIAPGAVATERTLARDPDYAEKYAAIIPTGRTASPTDIAHTALFLVSDEARQINGQTLIVDGGITSLCAMPRDIEKVN